MNSYEWQTGIESERIIKNAIDVQIGNEPLIRGIDKCVIVGSNKEEQCKSHDLRLTFRDGSTEFVSCKTLANIEGKLYLPLRVGIGHFNLGYFHNDIYHSDVRDLYLNKVKYVAGNDRRAKNVYLWDACEIVNYIKTYKDVYGDGVTEIFRHLNESEVEPLKDLPYKSWKICYGDCGGVLNAKGGKCKLSIGVRWNLEDEYAVFLLLDVREGSYLARRAKVRHLIGEVFNA